MKRITSKRKIALVLCLCAVTFCVLTVYAATTVRLAAGRIAFLDLFDGPADVVMTKATFEPGDTGTWHYHPDPVYIVVTAGTLTKTDGCGNVEQYSAGDAFVENPGVVQQVTNQGTVPAEFYTTNISPAGQPSRIDVDGPLCGPPRRRKECKNGGWMRFNHPRTFRNQGDCIQFVNTGR